MRRLDRRRRVGGVDVPRIAGLPRMTLLVAALAVPGAAAAQIESDAGLPDESRLLREAATRESVGDFQGAEALLRALLERNATSSGGLFALERVLRAQGRVAEILPVADAYLERSPTAAAPRYLKMRVLVEVDSTEALADEAEAWIGADPRSPDPYREVARVYERAFGPEMALTLLERGRAALDDPSVLALETGDLLVRLDRHDEAVREWSRVIGADGGQVSTLLRRINQLPGNRPALVRPLVEELGRGPTTPARLRAGARIALEVGLEEEALELARRAVPELVEPARRGFLTELSREAQERDADRLALWAFERLRRGADGAEARALDQRIAGAALQLGDTAAALEAQARIAEGLPRGSSERRRALATALRLDDVNEWRGLKRRLDSFRSEYPHAEELDEIASTLSVRFQAEGNPEAATAILEGVDGPRSSLERAYLRLASTDPADARDDFLAAAASLPPDRATEVIQLASLLGSLKGDAARLAARAVILEHQREPDLAVSALQAEIPSHPPAQQPALLGLGARLADQAGLEAEAASFRETLVRGFPEAPESGEAVLSLARYWGRSPETRGQAAELLEALILERPQSPVAPAARRELERLRRPGPDPRSS